MLVDWLIQKSPLSPCFSRTSPYKQIPSSLALSSAPGKGAVPPPFSPSPPPSPSLPRGRPPPLDVLRGTRASSSRSSTSSSASPSPGSEADPEPSRVGAQRSGTWLEAQEGALLLLSGAKKRLLVGFRGETKGNTTACLFMFSCSLFFWGALNNDTQMEGGVAEKVLCMGPQRKPQKRNRCTFTTQGDGGESGLNMLCSPCILAHRGGSTTWLHSCSKAYCILSHVGGRVLGRCSCEVLCKTSYSVWFIAHLVSGFHPFPFRLGGFKPKKRFPFSTRVTGLGSVLF